MIPRKRGNGRAALKRPRAEPGDPCSTGPVGSSECPNWVPTTLDCVVEVDFKLGNSCTGISSWMRVAGHSFRLGQSLNYAVKSRSQAFDRASKTQEGMRTANTKATREPITSRTRCCPPQSSQPLETERLLLLRDDTNDPHPCQFSTLRAGRCEKLLVEVFLLSHKYGRLPASIPASLHAGAPSIFFKCTASFKKADRNRVHNVADVRHAIEKRLR
jgi:hypothetical protein